MPEDITQNPETSSTTIEADQPGSQGQISAKATAETQLIQHPNIIKIQEAIKLVCQSSKFYESDAKVKKVLEVCKLTDSSLKYWRSSMTNARKDLNDKAMEKARDNGSEVVMPSEEAIEALAIEKFKDTWKKYGKGKSLPPLPLKDSTI